MSEFDDLSKVIDDAVDAGINGVGGTVAHLAGQVRRGTGHATAPSWTPEEEQFLEDNYGLMTEAEIGRQLAKINGGFQRSALAVHQRRERDMELPSPSKHPDYMTAYRIGKLLNTEERKPGYWIDMGIMPGEYIKVGEGSDRTIRRVHKKDLIAWLVNPENWVYFNIFKMQRGTRALRMVHLRRMRLGWCWLTTRQVATMHKIIDAKIVQLAIKRGRIKHVRHVFNIGTRDNGGWGTWFIRSDEAIALDPLVAFPSRSASHKGLTEKAEAFLLLCRAVGIFMPAICKMMKPSTISEKSLAARSNHLPSLQVQTQGLISQSGYPILYDADRAQLFCDWRHVTDKFPWLQRSIQAFLAGEETVQDLINVRGVLWRWCLWDGRPAALAISRKALICTITNVKKLAAQTRRLYAGMQALNIDPLQERTNQNGNSKN